MDKTTTWLVRGAAIVVIIVGWVSYLEPYLKKQELIRLNRNYENQKSNSIERCDQKKRISYSELLDLINSGQVKSIMLSPDTSLVEIISFLSGFTLTSTRLSKKLPLIIVKSYNFVSPFK